jgi:hypothetical protein
MSAVKKYGKLLQIKVSNLLIGLQPLQDIEELNMFKDDNTVMNFKKPMSKKSIPKNLPRFSESNLF